MKIRYGFVTNSSSSSFIIKRSNQFDSIEKIYGKVRELYTEWQNNRKQLLAFCSNSKDFCVSEICKEHYTINTINCQMFSDEWTSKDSMLKSKFGIGLLDDINYLLDWLQYKTYKEYLSHTTNPPFTIIDLKQVIDEGNFGNITYIVDWYIPCYEDDAVKQGDLICKYCPFAKEKKHCAKNKNQNTILTLLGDFCICSECGNIPQAIVDKLYEMSNLACNHMG